MDFIEYVTNTKKMYYNRYSKYPKFLSFNDLTSEIQETMMRCSIEANHFQIGDNIDDIVILAQCIMIRDRLRKSNR